MELVTIVSGTASNSYATLVEAGDRIASADYDSSKWDSLSEDGQKDCLILATQVIERLPLRGRPVNRYIPAHELLDGTTLTTEHLAQALAFPRTVQADYGIIPQEVKDCQIDIAALLVAPNYPAVPSGETTRGAQQQGISSITLGSLSVRFRDTKQINIFSTSIDELVLQASTLVALRLQHYLTGFRGRRVDTTEDDIVQRMSDYSSSSSSSSLSSSSTSAS